MVGGSLAGCSSAIVLARAGHRVDVFERSRGDLVGRGGGIGTPTAVLDGMIAADVVDADMPRLRCREMPFVVRTPQEPERGRSAWALPTSLEAFHWSTLWDQLRKRVPDDAYHQGRQVVGAEATGDGGVALSFADGERRRFDLAVFADGYRSLGRRLLSPETELEYRGYMLWRGLLPESRLDGSGELDGRMPRISYTDAPGNLVAYYVPGASGGLETGRRLCNWAAYIPLPEDRLEEFMVDRDGTARVGTLPPGSVRAGEEQRMKALMRANVPAWYADMIERTERTYVQLIYTARPPAYADGRVCLVGDAGAVAQPFTGSGVFKGDANARALVAALEAGEDVESALSAWSADQVAAADRLLALGAQMERAFISDPLDLADADEEAVAGWWKAAVTFPADFTYAAESSDDPAPPR